MRSIHELAAYLLVAAVLAACDDDFERACELLSLPQRDRMARTGDTLAAQG